jgi:hypothetical protein
MIKARLSATKPADNRAEHTGRSGTGQNLFHVKLGVVGPARTEAMFHVNQTQVLHNQVADSTM